MGIRSGANCSDKPPKEKGPCAVMEYEQLSISVGAYNLHYGKYYNGHKKVLQLVPTTIWKKVYAVYIKRSHIAC